MKYIYVGKIVNTHGIKGEVRLLSKFRYKDKAFMPNMKIYVGNKKEEFTINTYRVHKSFDMLTFVGINNINEILYLKGLNAYINEEDLKLNEDEFLSENLIGFTVYVGDKNIGIVSEIIDTPANEVIKVDKVLIPYVKDFIKEIDVENKILYVNDVRGLL